MFYSTIYDFQSQIKFHSPKTQIPIQSLFYEYPKKLQL